MAVPDFRGLDVGRLLAPAKEEYAFRGQRLTTTEQLVWEGVAQLEPIRRKWLGLHLFSLALTAILGLGVFIFFLNSPGIEEVLEGRFPFGDFTPGDQVLSVKILVCVFAGGMVFSLFLASSWKKKDLMEKFNAWRREACVLFDPSAKYLPNSFLKQAIFDSSGLNDRNYNTYSGSGYLAVAGMEASSLAVNHKYTETFTTTDSQGKTQTVTRTVIVPIFHGLLMVIPAPLPHPCWVILRHRDQGLPSRVHSLSVASPHLNKHFAIGASEKFAGHRILTPTLMEALWEFTTLFKYFPGYSYRDNLLYIAISGCNLEMGQTPSKWIPITLFQLNKVIRACQGSIQFLKDTGTRLMPT